jgi:hypothetical protein
MQRHPLVEQPDTDNCGYRNEQPGTSDRYQVRAEAAIHSCRRLA